MDKYKNKYRIPSARAEWWDYGWNGAYFITICTAGRQNYFGEIKEGKMTLSPVGAIADVLWHEIPHHAPYVELGDFVVMPNHVHGILILDKPEIIGIGSPREQEQRQQTMSNISPKSNSVPTIIRSYKAAVTKHAHRLGLEMEWQPRYHDHVIRNDGEYQRISDYIVDNVAKWKEDKFYFHP